jgi:3-carboxy-cis,cis-muconate cycloisomerase
MRANIEQVRRALPPQAAQEWFDPGLARFAAQSVRAQLQGLRSRSDAVSTPATAGA